MEKIRFQDVFLNRLSCQSDIKELQIDASGYCLHYGKISPTFKDYFLITNPIDINYKNNVIFDQTSDDFNFILFELSAVIENSFFQPLVLGYNYSISNLFPKEKLQQISTIIQRISNQPYTHIYLTSDLLTDDNLNLLFQWNINEIRTDSTNLSNIKKAYDMGFKISVELESYPGNVSTILETLPKLNNIIHHLILKEIRVTKNNIEKLQLLPTATKIYKDVFYYVWDEGNVYTIIKEIIKQNLNFSVIDFNSSVERLLCSSDVAFLNKDETYYLI